MRESVLLRAPTVASSINRNRWASIREKRGSIVLWLTAEILRFAQDDNGRVGELIKMVVAVVLGDLDFYVEEVGEVSGG